MGIAKIHGAEYPIRKFFSNDFVFRIPLYQRPYSRTTEQAGEPLDDLLDFTGQGTTAVDDLSPYFLGSIVLIKQEHLPDAEIVDGSSGSPPSPSCCRPSEASSPASMRPD